MKKLFECPNCGSKRSVEQTGELSEDASMTCPVCKSQYAISAVLTSPGEGGEVGPDIPSMDLSAEPSPLENPIDAGGGEAGGDEEIITGDEEVIPGEEEIPGDEEVIDDEDLQITKKKKKESIENRVTKAFEQIEDGKELGDVMGSLLTRPIKIHSPVKVGPSLREARYDDLTPTPREYRLLLKLCIAHCPDAGTVNWAEKELAQIKGLTNWKQEKQKAPKNARKRPWKNKDREFRDPDSPIAYPESKQEAPTPRSLTEAEEKKDWEGDFASFNAKLFGATEDLGIPVDRLELVIQAFQDDGALSLNSDKVKIDLAKAKTCLVKFLKEGTGVPVEKDVAAVAVTSEPLVAPSPEAPVPDLTTPPPVPADLGNMPMESGEEGAEGNSIEDQVDRVLNKYFM